MTYIVSSGTLNPTIPYHVATATLEIVLVPITLFDHNLQNSTICLSVHCAKDLQSRTSVKARKCVMDMHLTMNVTVLLMTKRNALPYRTTSLLPTSTVTDSNV